MRAFPVSPVAVAGVFVLLLLAGLAPALAVPAAVPSRQPPPTVTPTPTPKLGGGGGGAGTGPLGPGGTFGEPHLRTPDGFGFAFQAAGEFVLVASTVDDLAVQVRQDPWQGSTLASINTAVAMSVAGDRVGVTVGTGPPLWVNGAPTTLAGGSLPLPRGGRVAREGAFYTISWPDDSAVAVGVRDKYLDVVVRLAAVRAGQVVGLLGNADGDPANDLTTRDGTVLSSWETADYRQLYVQFGRSWRVRPAESLFAVGGLDGSDPGLPGAAAIAFAPAFAQPGFPTALMPSALVDASDLPLEVQHAAEALCRAAGVVAADFLADCVFDVGLTGEPGFAASTAEIEALFAPVLDEPAGRSVYQFDGAIAGAGLQFWSEILTGWGFVEESGPGTLQMRVELDLAQEVNPVTQVAAMIQIQGDLFANSNQTFVPCSWRWESRQLTDSQWDNRGSVNYRVAGVRTESCAGWPESTQDYELWFQAFVVDERTLALYPTDGPNKERSECLADSAALLVVIPGTP